MVAEVTNTPWHERHSYVVGPPGTHEIVKALHVSPFLGMDQIYQLEVGPGAKLDVGFGVVGPDGARLYARVHLERKPGQPSVARTNGLGSRPRRSRSLLRHLSPGRSPLAQGRTVPSPSRYPAAGGRRPDLEPRHRRVPGQGRFRCVTRPLLFCAGLLTASGGRSRSTATLVGGSPAEAIRQCGSPCTTSGPSGRCSGEDRSASPRATSLAGGTPKTSPGSSECSSKTSRARCAASTAWARQRPARSGSRVGTGHPARTWIARTCGPITTCGRSSSPSCSTNP